jgi:AraC family transcriptional regulator of adaptative response/methylated-DNA-[protein]-cysteine methyltransferase
VARRANRENVRFHPSASAAERAGFRACKKCGPDSQRRDERDVTLVTAACRHLARAVDDGEGRVALAALAQNAGMSPWHFHRLFKRITGVTPAAFAAMARHRRVQDALRRGADVTAAIYAAGFQAPSRFYDVASDMLGMRPSVYRKGAPGEEIWHASARCSLGWVLVAGTSRGLCAILLGDNPKSLKAEFAARFAKARVITPAPSFEEQVKQVVRLVDDPRSAADLPLDIRGTAFQRRVWEALRKIPAGETVTYGGLAARLGAPKAVRAVAAACAANSLAVAVPCHRVIGADGNLTGYRWGLERKHDLLKREQ